MHTSSRTSRRRRLGPLGALFLILLTTALMFGAFAGVAAAADSENGETGDEPVAATIDICSTDTGDVGTANGCDPEPPEPADNNSLDDECGIDVVIVIDRSGSTRENEAVYKSAANKFVNALDGTPSQIGVVTFGSTASTLSGYLKMDVLGNAGILTGLINGLPVPNDSTLTNWQDAMEETASSFTSPVPDLVLFITDGNPTTDNGDLAGYDELESGIYAANALKANNATHITGIGIPGDFGPALLDNIAKITGAGAGLGGADPDVHSTDLDGLEDLLLDIATELCGGTVNIHKSVKTGPNTYRNAGLEEWFFSSTNATPANALTNASGNATLEFSPNTPPNVLQTISEGGVGNHTIESVVCTLPDGEDQGTDPDPIPVSNITASTFAIYVGQLDIISCEVKNLPAPASITVAKGTTSGVGGPFAFNVSGPNATNSNLQATTSQVANPATAGTASNLYPGLYTVVETSLPAGASLTGVDCGAATTQPAQGGVVVDLGAGENVTCTFTNDIPVDLSILKTSETANPVPVGTDQVEYTLAVTNNGPGENAGPIEVTDELPTGLTYASASGTGWVCDNVGNTITCTHAGQLAVGATSEITVLADIDGDTIGQETENCATVSDPVQGDDNDTSCVTNDYLVDLSIVKSSPIADPVPSGTDQMEYTLAVTNNGPGRNLDPIVVTDTLPTGLGYVSASGIGWDCDYSLATNTITCTYDGQLSVGETSEIDVVADIDPDTIQDSTTNCATVADDVVGDDNDESCVTHNTEGVQVLAAAVTQPPAPVAAAAAAIAFTGANSPRLVAMSLGLILLGAVVALAARRRYRTDLG